MKSNKVAFLALSMFLTANIAPKAYAFTPASELTDLSTNHWAYKAIEALSEKYGVMSGYPDKTFKGSKFITRYEMAAALYKVMTKVEELIAKANRPGASDTSGTGNSLSSVNKEDLETLSLLQKEFRDELAELRGKVNILTEKLNYINRVKIGGKVEFKYRDRVAVTDSTKLTSPLNGFDVDGDKGRFRFNDSVRNLVTEFDRTPFRMRTTIDLSSSWNEGVRFYGSFVADDGTLFKLGPVTGQAVGGHFGEEGLAGSSFFTQKAMLSIRNNFERELLTNSEIDWLNYQKPNNVGTSFYHEDKSGYGLSVGFMNFQNILRPGTKFKNHFNSEKWVGHGYGLVGFGADDILVKDFEVTNPNGTKEKIRNSVSRFWASGINASQVDPDSSRYNNVSSPSIAVDGTFGPLTVVVGANAGSPYANRISALTNNLGAGALATGALPNLNAAGNPALSVTGSPSGILTGSEFLNDVGGALVNEKVILGSKDPLSPRNTYNLIGLPSEYGDGYGVLGLDLDLGLMRFGLNYSDYWLDSTFSLSGTRKNLSGVFDFGTDAMGITVQTNYNAIGLDTYSAAFFMNNIADTLDLGIGLKTATRGLFNFGQNTGTNMGFYVVLPPKTEMMPKLSFAVRQTFGDNFGSPVDLKGNSLTKVSFFKDSGITLGASLARVPGTTIGIDVEYNGLVEGSLLSSNFMAHDLGVFTTYKF